MEFNYTRESSAFVCIADFHGNEHFANGSSVQYPHKQLTSYTAIRVCQRQGLGVYHEKAIFFVVYLRIKSMSRSEKKIASRVS
jgi:hypothetical protein